MDELRIRHSNAEKRMKEVEAEFDRISERYNKVYGYQPTLHRRHPSW
jgi:hypothetical protein